MPLNTPDYSKTIMYKIVSKNEQITDTYIGHTTNIKSRTRHHYENVIYPREEKDYMVYQFIRNNGGWDNFDLVIIEEYPCQTCDEARLRERYWYDLLQPTLNSRKPIISKIEYHELTKNRKREYDKLYREKNKEKITANKIKYQLENKAKISERRKLQYQEKRNLIVTI